MKMSVNQKFVVVTLLNRRPGPRLCFPLTEVRNASGVAVWDVTYCINFEFFLLREQERLFARCLYFHFFFGMWSCTGSSLRRDLVGDLAIFLRKPEA